MTPDQVAALRDMALTVTQPMQDYLLQDICRRVAKAGKMTSTAEYQIYRAQALGAAKKEIAKAIAKQTNLSNAEIDRMFQIVADTEIAFEDNGSLQQIVAGYAATAKRTAAASLSDMQMVTPANNVKPMMDVYGESMDFAFKQVATGAADYTTALRMATKNLAARGIREIMQADGRSIGIEFACRRNLMNQLGLLDEKITQANHDELGCDGWEISAHAGCAPDHEDIQGRQFADKEYKLLNSRLQRRIGTLNCKHVAMPIILGVNSPQYNKKQLQQFKDDNVEGVTYQGRHYTLYAAGQKQAEIESHIRRAKYQCLADESLGDKEKLQTDQIRLVRLREEYLRFCRATGQPTQTERLQIAGFGHSQATRATHTYKKYESEQSLNAPQPVSKYVKNDVFDLEQAKKDFAQSLTEFPQRNRILLQYYTDTNPTDFIEDVSLKGAPFAYSPSKDAILYNPADPTFKYYDFSQASVHELAHRIDSLWIKAQDNKPFLDAIDIAAVAVEKQADLYQLLCSRDRDGYLTDVISAICKGQLNLKAGHPQDYWKRPKTRQAEIFAELFTMETLQQVDDLKATKQLFPEIWRVYDELLSEVT